MIYAIESSICKAAVHSGSISKDVKVYQIIGWKYLVIILKWLRFIFKFISK